MYVYVESPTPPPIISQNGGSLTENYPSNFSGCTLQWYLDTTIIVGANAQTFTPTQNGLYIVTITSSNGCSATSASYTFTSIGIEEIDKTSFTIFPNPFTYQTTISFSEVQKNSTIKIIDVLGKEIKEINFAGKH